MDTARDLACADLWQASLERSLARRGRPTRSSLELFHLQPERDLSRIELLRESTVYSQLRRSAVSRRPSMALPGAGGISALALLAATTLPGLLSGRTGSVRTARITYRADEHGSEPPKARVAATASAPTASASAATASAAATAGTLRGTDATVAGTPAHAAEPQAGVLSIRTPRPVPAHPAPAASTSAHTGTAADVTGGASPGSPTVSGGAAPAVEHSVAAASAHAAPAVQATPAVHRAQAVHGASSTVHAAPAHRLSPKVHTEAAHPVSRPVNRGATSVLRAPAPPKATTHVHTGGGAIEEATSVGHPRSTSTPAQPVAHPKPVAPAKPIAHPHPVATTQPVANPAPKPAPAPAVAPGQYTTPLAGASVTPERIDQGVDYSGSGPLGAIGDGKITYVGTSGTGWPGAFVEYQLTDGSDAGKYVYYAEGISPAPGLQVGETVQAGQKIAEIIAGSSSGIEIGWGSGVGTQPLAQALGEWSGGDDANSVPSAAGKDFSALIAQLGGPPGKVEG